MNWPLAFNIILVCGLLSSCCYLLIKRRNNPKYAPVCDPQLKTVMDFMNWTLIDLLERLSKPIDDSLENEYGENMYLLREQAGRHLRIVTEYNSWVKSVSEYPGWAVHIMNINGDYEEDYYRPWSIMVSTGLNTTREFIVRQQSIMYLIDCLESMNDYNEKLVEMIKGSE